MPSKTGSLCKRIADKLSLNIQKKVTPAAIWNLFDHRKEVVQNYINFQPKKDPEGKKDKNQKEKVVDLKFNKDIWIEKIDVRKRFVGKKFMAYPKENWTEFIHSQVEQAFGTPCCFKYSYVNQITLCQGTCSECYASVNVKITKQPPEIDGCNIQLTDAESDNETTDITVRLELCNFNSNIVHKKKRQLTQELKAKISEDVTSNNNVMPYSIWSDLRVKSKDKFDGKC